MQYIGDWIFQHFHSQQMYELEAVQPQKLYFFTGKK